MKKVLFCFLLFSLLLTSIFSQVDDEYLKLYRELLKIFRNEFIPPIHNVELIFKNDLYWGFGYKIDVFTGGLDYRNRSLLNCPIETIVFSITPGIVKEVNYTNYYGDILIIKYNEIEIEYRNITLNKFNIGDEILIGQILGKVNYVNHNYFNEGLILTISYFNYYFDAEILFGNIGYYINNRKIFTE